MHACMDCMAQRRHQEQQHCTVSSVLKDNVSSRVFKDLVRGATSDNGLSSGEGELALQQGSLHSHCR